MWRREEIVWLGDVTRRRKRRVERRRWKRIQRDEDDGSGGNDVVPNDGGGGLTLLVEVANIVREPREVSIDRDQEGAVGFEVVWCTMVGKKHSYSEWSLAVRSFSGSWLYACMCACARIRIARMCRRRGKGRRRYCRRRVGERGDGIARYGGLPRRGSSFLAESFPRSRRFSRLRDLTDPLYFAFMHACSETTRSSTS